ncbi:NnrU protein [Halioglobus japonicus]|uniref:NnrU protein n=1 Tax=Halioglobus japonicus TaxID=930805 RepID=A0AAP8MD31_9GAMM|nr:NnrU family protein [Halioglobus japonicus]AQA17625.1 NnrU protein [Halioglobus japonicus]PLW85565.1 NnrU protein [Halioglobus japonicus]GHD16299.1 membrane protein [Halioglobus japonicus]
MTLILVGLLLWAAVHFIPSLAPDLKTSLKNRLGEGGYMGLFSLALVAALVLMVFGWRSVEQPTHYYTLPLWTRDAGMGLILVAMILFMASKPPTRIRRIIRHPQLTGLIVWALAHLMMNGDNRSVLLFSGLAVWGALEILLINRREGEWVKPEAPSWGKEIVVVLIGCVAYAIFAFAHPWLAGVAVF